MNSLSSRLSAIRNHLGQAALAGLFAALSMPCASAQGLNWTQRNTGVAAELQYTSAAYGNGKYVVLAYGNNPSGGFRTQAAVSTDGVAWSVNTLPTNPVSRGLTFGAGLFVATAERNGSDAGNTQNILTSPDGTNWTARTTGVGSLTAVAFTNGRFVAVGSTVTHNAVTSTDGSTWTRSSIPSNASYFNGVTAHATNGSFLAWSPSDSSLYRTTDGTNWTKVTPVPGAAIYRYWGVTYSNGEYMMLAKVAPGDAHPKLYQSADGLTWTAGPAVTVPANLDGAGDNSLAASNSLGSGAATVVIIGGVTNYTDFSNKPYVVSSSGALTTWDSASFGSGGTFVDNRFVAYLNNLWLLGNNQTQLYTRGEAGGGTGVAPAITTQPLSVTVTAGGSATFSVVATGTGVAYQWRFNGTAITGATSASYTLSNVAATHAGTYTVVVSNSVGSITSTAATLTVNPAPSSGPGAYLANLSIRARAGTGAEALIVGMTIGGTGTTGTKNVLARGVGPGLTGFGVTTALADPTMTAFSGPTALATNDNWSGNEIATTSAAMGAFALTAGSKDAALLATNLAPGGYTLQITGVGGTAGIALAELYDTTASASYTATTPRLTNISSRTFVGTGDATLICGFVVSGTGQRRVLIRAVGPGLAPFGLTGLLADPQLALYQGATKIAENDNWDAATLSAQKSAFAFDLAAGSKDAVLVATLNPGLYSVQATGAGGTTGIALIEMYELP